MKFRPCIDIHNGKVKQIVGGTLLDAGDQASENFVSELSGADYADLYRRKGLSGGHIILLNPASSSFYEATKTQAMSALSAWRGGLQIGGGIHAENAEEFLDAGASHVIVTSYVFRDGRISYENLEKLKSAIGPEHLVLDLSCRKKAGDYYIVTDRWQKFTDTRLTVPILKELSSHCNEFLIHAVDVEGKASGIEIPLASMLSEFCREAGRPFPVTYAGGVGSFSDLDDLKTAGRGDLDVTIGSALDLFGGPMKFEDVLKYLEE